MSLTSSYKLFGWGEYWRVCASDEFNKFIADVVINIRFAKQYN